MIYVTSDLHFHHTNIIRICNRPFEDVAQMNRRLIQNWNDVVRPEDEVYVLGDFTLKGMDAIPDLVGQLKGKKYLIRGNHDRFARFDYCDGFEWVKDYHEIQDQNNWFILCHYPITDWNHMYRGSYQLHGHIHGKPAYNQGNMENRRLQYDVGVDANNYTPITLLEIARKFQV